MTVLQGDPFNLQGSAPVLQPAGNPQQVYGPVPPVTSPAPVAPAPVATAPKSATPVAPVSTGRNLSSQYGLVGSTVYRKSDNHAFTNAPEFLNEIGAKDFTGLQFDTRYNPSSYQPPVISQPTQQPQAQPQAQPTQPTDPNQALAQAAARAGLSLDDYLKLNSPTVTPEEKAQIRQSLGIDQLEQSVFSPPAKNTEQLYTDAYTQAGLADVKAKIQTLFDQINKAQNDFTDASGVVNENPFLSEASRVGRISRLNDKAQAQITNLTNQLGQLQDLYNNGVNEVNSLVSRQTTDFSANQSLNAQKLQYLLQKAEGQVTDLQTSKSATALQYLPDYLKAKAAATKPDTIGSAESGYYRWNPDTGTFEQVIAPTVIPNYQANPLTGDLFNTKTGQSLGSSGSSGGGFPTGAQTPGSAAAVNNPLGIKPNGKFAQYTTPDEGFQAGVQLVQKYQTNGPAGMNANSTLNQMVNTWITGNPNNTNKTGYSANNVAQYLQQLGVQGVTANTPIGQIDSTALAAAIAHFETGYSAGSGTSSLLNSFIETTPDGMKFIDQSKLEGAQKTAITYQAHQAGIPVLAAADAEKVKAIAASEINLNNIQNMALGFLPSNPSTRIIVGPTNQLQKFLQTNPDINAFQAWRTAIINNIQALAGGAGSGLRINQAEIDTALENDLPTIADTVQVAQRKLDTLRTQLQTWKGILLGPQATSISSASNDPLGLGI